MNVTESQTFEAYLEQLKDNLTSRDMPNDDLRYIFEECGCDVALALIKKFDFGSQISIPGGALKQLQHRYIRDMYAKDPSRMTILRLGNELKIADKTISEILKMPDLDPGATQLSLMDQELNQ